MFFSSLLFLLLQQNAPPKKQSEQPQCCFQMLKGRFKSQHEMIWSYPLSSGEFGMQDVFQLSASSTVF